MLKVLQMKESDLDSYTTMFWNLTAGHTLDAMATVDLYLSGFPKGLLSMILKCDSLLETLMNGSRQLERDKGNM